MTLALTGFILGYLLGFVTCAVLAVGPRKDAQAAEWDGFERGLRAGRSERRQASAGANGSSEVA